MGSVSFYFIFLMSLYITGSISYLGLAIFFIMFSFFEEWPHLAINAHDSLLAMLKKPDEILGDGTQVTCIQSKYPTCYKYLCAPHFLNSGRIPGFMLRDHFW